MKLTENVINRFLAVLLVSFIVFLVVFGHQVRYKEYLAEHETLSNEALYQIEGYKIDGDGYWVVRVSETDTLYKTRTFIILDAQEESLEVGYYILLEKNKTVNYFIFMFDAFKTQRHYKATIVIAL